MTPYCHSDALPVCRVKVISITAMVVFFVLLTLAGRAAAGPVKIDAHIYNSLQAAYAVAASGAVLQSQEGTFSEGLLLNRDIDITLAGGYDPAFTANDGGPTTISGPLIVGAGSIVVENLSIAGSNAAVFVPDVIGATYADAQTAIVGAGLALGAVTRQESATIPVGAVISQAPPSGTPVALGSAIDLVISSGPPVVTLVTTMGTITITLFPGKAPLTVQNFLTYVQDGFYDGLVFHRVMKDFMIQGGGLDLSLTPRTTRPPIPNEANNGLSNRRGTVAMARTAVVDSATSQFFINVVDNPFLDYRGATPELFGYAVFGEVTGGMDVVDAIRAVPTVTYYVYANLPANPVIIQSARRAP